MSYAMVSADELERIVERLPETVTPDLLPNPKNG